MAKNQRTQSSPQISSTPQTQSQELSDSQTPTTPESTETDQTQNQNPTTVDTETQADSSLSGDSTEGKADEAANANDGSWTLGDSAASPGISTADSDGEHAGDGTANEIAVKPAEGAPAGHIIRLGEEITIPATVYKNHAVVSADVFKERKLRGSKRITYVQVYTAGTAIPLTALQQK